MRYETPEIFELGDAEKLTLFACRGGQTDFDGFPRFIYCPEPPSMEDEPAQE
jgi:hypothetical protein